MATPTTSVRDYCVLLAKSKLVPAELVEGLRKRWLADAGGADDQVDQFRKFLVGKKALTEYQAALIQRGRADNFFLGGYKILDRVGKGHMGGVYKAVHNSGQVVALKILPASKAKDPHVLGRFQREARLLTLLDHPNVVRGFQVGESNGVHFIAMDFLEGETLDEVLARRKLMLAAEAVRLVRQVLDGLQHLHDRRTVHRDIKPANLMLTPVAGKPDTTWDATVKVLDIGLGRELFDENTPAEQTETQLTAEGAVLGTPDYLAPEQARDARTADIRADLYSVGCVLYHCITGRPPFTDANIMTQMLKHATEKPAPLDTLVADVPPLLQEVMDRLLAKLPAHRYTTPAEAGAALAPFAASRGAAPAAAPMVPAYKNWLATESQLELPNELPPAPPKPAKPGTGTAPALAKAKTTPATALGSGKPGTAPARPLPPPMPIPLPAPIDEVDVELVPEPLTYGAPQVQYVPMPDDRTLVEFDRRDWIMLATGAASILAAVGVGYGVARLARKKPEESPPEEGAGS